MQNKNFIKGTIILATAGIVAKLTGFFFRIPLIYMIGEEGIGLYQLTYPLYTFLLALSAGIPTAISKMISERMALGKTFEAVKIFKIALFIMTVFGGISSLSLIIFSNLIINTLNWNKDVYYSLLGISMAPLFTCVLSTYRGYFQGLQYMTPTATSQIIEQIIRVVLGVSLAYMALPFGIAVSAGFASFGATAGAFVGFIWMVICYYKNKLTYKGSIVTLPTIKISGEILKIAIPVSLGQAIGSIATLIDSALVPLLLNTAGFNEKAATILFGQLTGKAFVLINVPLTISFALAQSTVPAISESYALKDKEKLKRNITLSFKMALILALPCSAGLYTLAKPIILLIFQGMGDGWELLQILSLASFFIIIAQTSTSILNGLGKTVLPVIVMVFGCIIKIAINIIFIPIPSYNIKAAAYGTLISYIVVALIDFYLVMVYSKVYINIQEVLIPALLCTVVMIFSVVLVYTNILNVTLSVNLTTFLSVIFGIVIYFLMLILTRTLKIKDIKNFIRK